MLFVKTFMKQDFWGQHSGTITMRRGWLKSELMSTFVCLEWLTVRELLPRKKLFSFKHCSNYLSPPPPFFGHQEPWVQIISNLEEKALFIDQEVDCGKRVKNFGQGPPPQKETFFQGRRSLREHLSEEKTLFFRALPEWGGGSYLTPKSSKVPKSWSQLSIPSLS